MNFMNWKKSLESLSLKKKPTISTGQPSPSLKQESVSINEDTKNEKDAVRDDDFTKQLVNRYARHALSFSDRVLDEISKFVSNDEVPSKHDSHWGRRAEEIRKRCKTLEEALQAYNEKETDKCAKVTVSTTQNNGVAEIHRPKAIAAY